MAKVGRNDPCPCGSGIKYKKCCLSKPGIVQVQTGPDGTVVVVEDPDGGSMRLQTGGRQKVYGVDVWIPRIAVEVSLRRRAEQHLREKYAPGVYGGRGKVNEILQYQFSYYESLLSQELTRIASRNTLEFVLYQNEQWTQVFRKWHAGENASPEEQRFCERRLPLIRRGLKHLLDVLCLMDSSQEEPEQNGDTLFWALETVFISAEQLSELSQQRSQTFRLFPDTTEVIISPSGEDIYFDLRLGKEDQKKIDNHRDKQNAWQRAIRSTQSGVYQALQLDIFKTLPTRLDPSFRQDLGYSYSDIVNVLKLLKDSVQVGDHSFAPFVLRQQAVEGIADYLHMSEAHVGEIIDMFTLTPDRLRQQPPEIWKPKRDYRVLRRPFLQVPHSLGYHLAYNYTQIDEALIMFATQLQKQKLPPDLSGRGAKHITEALGKLHGDANGQLETIALSQLTQKGFFGRVGVKNGSLKAPDGADIQVPADVGEVDLVCIDPKHSLLLVGECKNVLFASEPSLWYEDIQEFAKNKKSYRTKFLKKIEWAASEAPRIIPALAREAKISLGTHPWKLATVMITAYETLASEFITEFPCLSMELLLEQISASGGWPFPEHIKEL